jgi:Protein of unknown function (DUF1571)
MDRRDFVKMFLMSTGLAATWNLPKASATTSKEVLDSKFGPAIRVCDKCLEILAGVEDFETMLSTRELNGNKMRELVARVKFRTKPRSVYMIFGKPHEGREVIFVEGQNNNELLVHEVGIKSIVGPIQLDPNGKMAMQESHYPITQFGLDMLIEGYRAQWEQEALLPGVEVKYYPNAAIGDTECKVIESRHTTKSDDAKFAQSRLYLDAKTHLPVRSQQYVFPKKKKEDEPILYEEYTYLDMKTNVGFKDIDFDPKNPNYNFNL